MLNTPKSRAKTGTKTSFKIVMFVLGRNSLEDKKDKGKLPRSNIVAYASTAVLYSEVEAYSRV